MRLTLALFLVSVVVASCSPPRQVVEITRRAEPADAVEAAPMPAEEAAPSPYAGIPTGRFDGGKMWTFDHPPLDYFEAAYGFRPDSVWLARARGAALRFSTNCSASFVSPSGLVMTNHHCAREHISKVSTDDEALLDNGFYAKSLEDERKVEDLTVEQLIDIRDITDEIYGQATGTTEQAQQAARERRATATETRLTVEAKASDSTLHVQVIPLYNGGRYAAYTFRTYEDVRLVMAPELQIGFFGGEWDNFTYPRYNLDMSFFRVYGPDGEPAKPEHHFGWDADGAAEGEPVFVVGNPGSTSRLSTVSQLTYARDVDLPMSLSLLQRRADLLKAFIDEHPDIAEEYDIRNSHFSIENSIKSMAGQLEGLRGDWLIPRRGAAETAVLKTIQESDSLDALYGNVLTEISGVQRAKEASAGSASAFGFFLNPAMSSHVLARAMYGYFYTIIRQRGAPPDDLAETREEALEIEDWPVELEKLFLALRLEELQQALGKNDPTMRSLLGDRSPEEVAAAVIDSTALTDSTAFREILDENYLFSGDSSVELIQAIAPLYFTLSQQLQNFETREDALNARFARARFTIDGTDVPPDASFSLRLSDGVVSAYDYNGTRAPTFTTFFGLYERFFSAGHEKDWALPERWIDPPESFDYATPVNLVSTNDITGGNSGSPLVDRDLRVVGLVFDSNIDALPNEYLYTDTNARSISVDARGIIEALDEIYDADRLVRELLSGTLFATEAEADAAAINQ